MAPEGTSVAFELCKENGFKWLGQYDITVEALLSGRASESKQEMAETLITDMLADGEVRQKEVWDKASLWVYPSVCLMKQKEFGCGV